MWFFFSSMDSSSQYAFLLKLLVIMGFLLLRTNVHIFVTGQPKYLLTVLSVKVFLCFSLMAIVFLVSLVYYVDSFLYRCVNYSLSCFFLLDMMLSVFLDLWFWIQFLFLLPLLGLVYHFINKEMPVSVVFHSFNVFEYLVLLLDKRLSIMEVPFSSILQI